MSVIKQYLQDIINGAGGWRSFELHEVVVTEDRDLAIAEWVIRCLGNPESTQAEEVLKELADHRFKNKPDIRQSLPTAPVAAEPPAPSLEDNKTTLVDAINALAVNPQPAEYPDQKRTLIALLTGTLQYDSSWGIYAERLDGEFKPESPARFGQTQFNNDGVLDDCEPFGNNEFIQDRLDSLVGWTDGTEAERDEITAEDWRNAALLLIDEINEQ